MLKTLGLKPRKLYLLHVLWSVQILLEQTMYALCTARFNSYEQHYTPQLHYLTCFRFCSKQWGENRSFLHSGTMKAMHPAA